MKPRLRNRNGRWDASIEIWQGGERKVLSAGTHPTQEAAQDAGWALALKYADNSLKRTEAHSTMTLAQWSERWLLILDSDVKINTLSNYKWRLNKWILPKLGSTRLTDLSGPQIRLWLDGMKLGYRSKKGALSTLSAALEAAKSRGLISANPCREVKLTQSKAKKASQKVKAWTPDQAQALLAVSDPTQRLIIHLGLYGALRKGEILGLEWSDVDWLGSRIHIQRNVVSTPDGVEEDTPKSGEDRWVKLSSTALSVLAMAREAAGEADGRLFTLSPRQTQTLVEKASRNAGVPGLGCHALRHTCASLLLSSGVSVVAVANHLGHSDPAVTLRYYAHLMPQDPDQCAGALDAALTASVLKVAA